MRRLFMNEIRLDIRALLRFLQSQGILERTDGDDDLGYGVHAWLGAAFGTKAPKPWRLLHDGRRPTRILGYSSFSADHLRQSLSEFADPSVFEVCRRPAELIASREMPRWQSGRRLGFELQCCPVGRKAGTGIEKDLFLIRADAAEQDELRRDEVYRDWAAEQIQRDGAATVTEMQLAGFRLVRQTRRTGRDTGERKRRRLIRPMALLRGELVIGDPEAFSALLARGVGRHRSFGYGMLLLRPAT